MIIAAADGGPKSVTSFSKVTGVYSAGQANIVQRLMTPGSFMHWLAVCVLIMIGIILRLIFFQGYSDSDPREYAALADQLAHGEWHISDYDGAILFPVRFAIYVPTAFIFKLFGLSELTIATVPLLVSLGTFFVAYAVTRQLFNSLAGLFSIAILAIVPLDIAMATTLWPDPIAAFWANLGVGLLVFDDNRENRTHSAVIPILAGLCFGVSWLGKETVVYLGPFVAIYYYLYARQGRPSGAWLHLLFVGLAALFLVVAEAAVYRVYRGDWLFHFRAVEINYTQSPVWFFNQSSPYFGWNDDGYTKALLKRLLVSGPAALLNSFSKLPILAIIAAAWAAFMKDRRFVIPILWLLSLMAMFNFASTSLAAYKPLPLYQERYLYPILLPSTVLLSGALAALLQSSAVKELISERRFWAAVLIAAYSLSCAHGVIQLRWRPEQIVRDVLPKLNESDVVYTDSRTASILVFFRTGKLLPSNSTTIPYEDVPLDKLKSGSLVFANKDKLDFLSFSYGYKVPELVNNPPRTWASIWSERRSVLFRVE
jgi:4-amino-4-deoxy-L-arabinose transferase-like glycosyltransferase